jgi:hypothetical protein
MPSQINNPGNIGYLEGKDVSANYLKAKPSTRFATRQLQFYDIQVNGCQTDPYLSDSLYSRAVRGVQVAAEIYAVGMPDTDHFIVVVAQDTAVDLHSNNEDGDGDNNPMAQNLQNAIGSICQGVTPKYLNGNGFNNGHAYYSDESQNDD